MAAIRWGILGTGAIAKLFADGLRTVPDAELAAVGSRNMETADNFGRQFDVPHRHGSYDALVGDPTVDVVYVASPHVMHRDHANLALHAGKAVLCEKPFATSARQAEEMVALARKRKLFLMEAMWTRYLPVLGKVRHWLAEGAIGEVRMVQADFGYRAGPEDAPWLMDGKMGGGALLDVGIYPVSLASMVFGRQPSRIVALAHRGQGGVDEQAAMLLGYERGEIAVLACAIQTTTPQEARIIGTSGQIRIHSPFWRATQATLTVGRATQHAEMPYEGNGYNYEAAEVVRCLQKDSLESPVMPLDETAAIMRTMDAVRNAWDK